MTIFQYIAIALLVLLTILSIWAVIRRRARPLVGIAWIFVWIGTTIAIIFPDSITIIARLLGIKRGADLVLYGSVLAGLVGFFFLLTKFRATQRQMTILTRKIAIYDAKLEEKEEEARDPADARDDP